MSLGTPKFQGTKARDRGNFLTKKGSMVGRLTFPRIALGNFDSKRKECLQIAQLPRVTSIAALLGKPSENARDPPAEPLERPRTEVSKNLSKRQMSSNSLGEGCSLRMMSLYNFIQHVLRSVSAKAFASSSASRGSLHGGLQV